MNVNLIAPKRACIYTRVSSDEQVDGYSLDEQLAICTQFAKGRGWDIVAVFRDDGYSAKTTDRPDFQNMLFAAETGAFDVIVVHKLDRFSRSIVDVLVTLRELEKGNVTFASAAEVFDFSTPWGMVILVIIAAFAEWYIANLSEETKKGKLGRAKAGEWGGRVPFGYTAHYKVHGGDSRAVPDLETRNGFRLALDLARSGHYSYRAIANELNAHGYRPTGRAGERSLRLWSRDSVATMLRNRFYLGEIYHLGTWLQGKHEPLCTFEEWEDAQQAMASRRLVHTTQRDYSRVYLFGGIVKCGECGSPMRGTYYHKRGKDYLYYRCSGKERGIDCQIGQLAAPLVEATAEQWLTSIPVPDEWEEALRKYTADERPVRPGVSASQIRSLEDKLERLVELRLLGDIEREPYLAGREELKAQIAALKLQLGKDIPQATVATATLLKNIPLLWNVATPAERQQWLRAIASEVVLYADKSVYIKINTNLLSFFRAVGVLPEVGVVGFEPTLCAF